MILTYIGQRNSYLLKSEIPWFSSKITMDPNVWIKPCVHWWPMCLNSRSNKKRNKQAKKQTNKQYDCIITLLLSGCRSAACSGMSSAAAASQAAASEAEDDQKKEEMIHEIHRLRERIKCLETDNASMHTKLSKEQKNVSQRLAEIEMQINDEEYRLVWPQLLSWRDQIENTFWDFPTFLSSPIECVAFERLELLKTQIGPVFFFCI